MFLTRRDWFYEVTYRVGQFSIGATFTLKGLEELGRATAPSASGSPAKQPQATALINRFMAGGPSHVDTFDPKPKLTAENGKDLPFRSPPTSNGIGKALLASPYKFAQHGQSGAWVSELLPNMAQCVDDLAIVRSMCHKHGDHDLASSFTHTGYERPGRPNIGAWLCYGLGATATDLPAFVALGYPGPKPAYLSPGFLPATFEPTVLQGKDHPMLDLQRLETNGRLQQEKLALIRELNAIEKDAFGQASSVEALHANFECAIKMQTSIPDLYDFKDESRETLEAYGINEPTTAAYGTNCLIARRLIERGVRFVQVTSDGWDHHANMNARLRACTAETDKPIAGLIKDLKARKLLPKTLVHWGGEFGRTPNGQGTDGRDHNPFGYTVCLAGGGIRPGTTYGSTDEYGYFATENKVTIHDLHATLLHQMGIDHTKLTYRFGGRDFRLTDVYGEVVRDILV